MSGLLKRFLEWRRDLLTPEHVDKASRRERWKRNAWLIGSSMVTLFAAFVCIAVPVVAFTDFPAWTGAIPTFFVWMYASMRLHNWGMERFDLVPPWQFRDAEHEVSD
jgi:hypothetical protein